MLNQEEPWNLNWGVLYHLDNWQQDLRSALNHAPVIFLESEVADSDDPNFEIKVPESGYDQALSGLGTRPSAEFIERVLREESADVVRYQDSDLNSPGHIYDWPVTNKGNWHAGRRRFWIVRR